MYFASLRETIGLARAEVMQQVLLWFTPINDCPSGGVISDVVCHCIANCVYH
jgi:hypothetical protein